MLRCRPCALARQRRQTKRWQKDEAYRRAILAQREARREAAELVCVVKWHPVPLCDQWWTRPGRYRVKLTPCCAECHMPCTRSDRPNPTGLCSRCAHRRTGKYKPSINRRTRERLRERSKGCCEDCGCVEAESLFEFHAHHVVRPENGGRTHALSNLRFLCWDCHVGSGWARNHPDLVAA